MSGLRIGIVCHEYPPGSYGGIGTFTRKLGTALVASGHEVRVIGVYKQQHPGNDRDEDEGVQIWRLRKTRFRWGWAWDRIRLFRVVQRWAAQGEIDLIDVPDWQGWSAGWPRLPIPVVVRFNGCGVYFAAETGNKISWTSERIERQALRRADFCTSVSRYTADRTRELFGMLDKEVAVIHTPVVVPQLPQSKPRSRNMVAYTGTLTAKKGVISLVRAWWRVLAARPDAVLHLVGRDGQFASGASVTEYMRRELGDVAPSVHFRGFLPNDELHDILLTARVAIFPSYAEAFAAAPMEAMAARCPTIYSCRGSGSELIEHGVHGLLVNPDDPEEIANAIIRVLNDDTLAAQLAAAGQERMAREFSLDKIVLQNEDFYRTCIRRFRASRAVGRGGVQPSVASA